MYSAGELSIGCATQPIAGSLEECAHDLYGRMLRATAGQSLYRIWNYIPNITGQRLGLENYRAFNAGRARAFEETVGPGYRDALPAASAVGCRGRTMAVVFAAGIPAPRHFENPEQVPAYHYPAVHGPRAPSFARATLAVHRGRRLIFISGTSAIKGHETIAPRSTGEQIECTLDNLRLISRATGAGEDLGCAFGFERHFKVYLRNAEDHPLAKARLEGPLLQTNDHVVWLQADLCRTELNIEIEATLSGSFHG
jgi:hypothetical protein